MSASNSDYLTIQGDAVSKHGIRVICVIPQEKPSWFRKPKYEAVLCVEYDDGMQWEWEFKSIDEARTTLRTLNRQMGILES